MNRIRTHAKVVGHKIVGNLIRHPEKEMEVDSGSLEMKRGNFKLYIDEANNEYIVTKRDVCIITADGSVI